jgi:putative oxygen-independent coproporphyrinogen III oxidase
MAGIYIHVPFCAKRCIYCDFYSGTDMSQKDAYVLAVCEELRLRRDYIKGESIDTIYFGGGTPSQLGSEELGRIFSAIEENYDIANCREVTIEANPDDMTKDYVEALSHLSFNRVSMGVQSFHSKDLQFLNRRHGRQQALDAVHYCRKFGIENISLDLIYGLPNQTMKEWDANLTELIDLDVPHVSAYHLIYEEGTLLYRLKDAGKISPVDEVLSESFFSSLIDRLNGAGYEHYEISNFAKPNCYSSHNSSYWKGANYIGVGPSAHSFDSDSRQWNVASLKDYIIGIKSGSPNVEVECLDDTTQYNEYIITRLRTMWGVKLSEVINSFGQESADFCLKQALPYISKGLLLYNGDEITLSRQGIFISDSIMSDLLKV